MELARYWAQAGDWDKSLADAREAAAKDPKSIEAHSLAGDALAARKDPDGAMASYQAAIKLFNESEEAKGYEPPDYLLRRISQIAREKASEDSALGSDRLLLFIQFAAADDAWPVAIKIDGRAVDVKKAYNSIYGHLPRRTFLGFYADVSGLVPEVEHTFELIVPAVWPGQFQGVFFENIETEYTGVIRK